MMDLFGELYQRQYGRLVASLVRRFGAHRLDWAEELAQDAQRSSRLFTPYSRSLCYRLRACRHASTRLAVRQCRYRIKTARDGIAA